jgi:tetratricopeptide (TPR) repeat protein
VRASRRDLWEPGGEVPPGYPTPGHPTSWMDQARTAIEETGAEDVGADSLGRHLLMLAANFAGTLVPGRQASANASESAAALIDALPESGAVGAVVGLRIRGDRARSMGQLVAAENLYRQALALAAEAGGNAGSIEELYVALGDVAYNQQRLDEAERWCRMALAIHKEEKLTNKYTLSDCYRTLGAIAMKRRNFSDAGEWYHRSLSVCRELDDVPRLVHLYSKLGEAADRRGNIDAAEDWYRRTLVIGEEHGEEYIPIETYTGLAWIALSRNRFSDAESWCQQAIVVAQRHDNPTALSRPYYVLAATAFTQGDLRKALEMLVRCVVAFGEFPHPGAGEGPPRLAVIARHLGTDVLEETWERVTGEPLPAKVRNYVDGGQWPPLPAAT